jgi:cutinase
MPPAIAGHVAAVALFGTPDSWFLGLVDRSAPPIVIGVAYTAKTIQLW